MIPTTSRPISRTNVDLSAIQHEAQKRLFKLLDKFEGTKTIVWDDKLMGPFDLVASVEVLKKHDTTRLRRLRDFRLDYTDDTDYTLFFLRKDYHVAKFVAEVLPRAEDATLAKTSLVFIPQRCTSMEKVLELNKANWLKKLNSIEELSIEFFVLDTHLLSMENEFVYKDIYLNNDYSSIHQIVEGLVKLQDIYGQIPRISGQGKGAKLVCDLLLKRRKLQPNTSETTPKIQQLILIDRRIDLVTPLLTQLTYEGLLDEIFGINQGKVTLPAEKFRQGSSDGNENNEKPSTTKTIGLRSSDELFSKLRDLHTNSVAASIATSVKNLQAEFERCKQEDNTLSGMRKKVPQIALLKMAEKSQENHTALAWLVHEQQLKAEFIYGLRIEHKLLQEDNINQIIADIDIKLLRQEHPLHVLRLICAQSIINNGLKPKICDYYKREIIQNYGGDYLLFLMQLEKANLLLNREKFYETGSFSQLKNKFNLIIDDVDEYNPNHLSYVYGGYSPLAVKVAKILMQFTQTPLPRSISDNLKFLPGPNVHYVDQTAQNQASSYPGLGSANRTDSNNKLAGSAVAVTTSFLSTSGSGFRIRKNSTTSSTISSSNEEPRSILVFFIGGCTFAEVSALRFLSQQEENNCEFLIGTTKIINGKTFLRSLWPFPGKTAFSKE